jgi:hypothetical protein
MAHRTTDDLIAHLTTLRAAPRDEGTLELISRRPAEGQREILTEAELDLAVGLVGDNWKSRGSRHTEDGSADPDKQLNVMSHRMVSFLAPTPESQALAGDQLYVDLDLSVENLPAGSRVALGEAVIEITAPPHLGCAKFVERFGAEAMKFVNGREGRALRLRGLNAKVVTAGIVRAGDHVRVLSRPIV